MPNYRSKYKNYYSDKTGGYASVGSILPVIVDQHTDVLNNYTGAPSTKNIEYNYPGWIYTDGAQYDIKEYPFLYDIIGNRYNLDTDVDNTVEVQDVMAVGSIQKMFWDNDKLYFEILDDFNAPPLQDDKRAWPYNCNIRVSSLGMIPTGLFEIFGSPLAGGGFSTARYQLVLNDNQVGLLSSSPNRTVYKVLDKDGNDFDGTQYTQANYTIDFTTGGNTHPTFKVTKAFLLSDYPHFIGKFRVPDYRERKLLGYGDGVEGGGTSVVENRTSIKVGDIGGKWVIPTTRLDDAGSFYTISDVVTSGYEKVTAPVPMQLVGSVKYEVGPMADQPLARPAEHDHQLLHTRVDDSATPTMIGMMDEFTSGWRNQIAQVLPFVPGTADGTQLWHSHGIIGDRMQNASTATYGNVSGIGEVVDDTAACPDYRVTQAPPLPIASVTADGTDLTVSTTASHNLSVTNWITITNGGGNWDGNYEIKTVTSGVAFVAQKATGEVMPNGTMPAGAVVKQADGIFTPVPTLDDPLAYVVNDQTVIGNQPIIVYDPSQMETRFEEELTTSGTITKSLSEAGSDVAQVLITIVAPGGAGGNSTQNGGTPSASYVQFTFNNQTYTAYAYGGQGGQAGDAGRAGGNGGGVAILDSQGNNAIPILLNDSRFSINTQETGGSGGNGAVQSETGGPGGQNSSNPVGNGGAGSGQTFNSTTTSYFPGPGPNDKLYHTGARGASATTGTYSPPAGVVTQMTVKLSGGSGGDGNGANGGQAMSGCEGTNAKGGLGRNGSLLTLTASVGLGFQYALASGGGHGTATQINNNGEQPNNNKGRGENSEADGGTTGPGAWGNAGTGGCGGGASTIRVSGQLAAVAGGGGGGGGSGGGWNGGMWDTCDGGQAGQPPAAGLHNSNSIQCNKGGNGSSSGCTAGSGGGGGGGGGNAPSAGGGDSGQESDPSQGGGAGEGHGNKGGGKGGGSGQSAYRTSQWDTGSLDINGGSTENGYIQVTAVAEESGTLDSGGGGGAGGVLAISINAGPGDDLATGINAVLAAPGSGGAGGATDGKIYVKLAGLKAGESGETGRTTAAGRGYRCPDYPTSKDYDEAILASGTNIWADATTDGGSANDIKVLAPTTGTFPLAPSSMHDGKVTRFINFSGAGERKLTIGPLNGTYINTLYFDIIKGNGSNGGQTPQENLKLYYKDALDGSPTLADALVLTSVNDPNYNTYSYTFPVSSQAAIRTATLYLEVVQDFGGSDATESSFGISQMVATFNERISYVFSPSSNASIPGNTGTCGTDIGINSVKREVFAHKSGMFVNGGDFELNASNPVTVSSSVIVNNPLPLITKYFRSKYLIKAI